MTELSTTTTTTNNNNTDSKGTVLSSTPPAAAAALNSPTVTPTTPVSVDQQLLAINNQLRAQLLASALKSSLMGAAAGFGVGFLLFKRRLFPMWLGMGFGLGKTYGEAGRLLTMAHDELLRSLEDSREEQQQQKTQN